MVILFFLLKIPVQRKGPKLTIYQQFRKLDPIGTAIFIPGIVCLLLALQWGGGEYSWSSPRVIALLVLAPVLLCVFAVVQVWQQENATIPPRILKKRTVAAALWYTICVGSTMLTFVYYMVSPLFTSSLSLQRTTILTMPPLSLSKNSHYGSKPSRTPRPQNQASCLSPPSSPSPSPASSPAPASG